jgi:hypothetical protein
MRPMPQLLTPLLLAAILLSASASAQSSSGGGSSSSAGGSSGSAKTESAPTGTLRTGPDRGPANAGGGSATMGSGGSATMGGGSSATLGAPGGGTAPGSSRRGGAAGQQARVPDECGGPLNDPRCPTAGAPTGTGLGDRGTGGSDPRPYGPEQSPVKGGPPFTGPTGLPLDLPREGR